MKLKECYDLLGADYNGVLNRLMRETSISKFLIMMLKDTQWAEFHDSISKNDYETAFRNVHTLKGTSLNLGLTGLANVSSVLTEALRGGAPTCDISEMIKNLDAEYDKTMKMIKEYSENPEI